MENIAQLPLFPPETIEISLPKGYVTIVDWVDRDLAELKWRTHKSWNTIYVQRTSCEGQYRRYIGLHRVILSRVLGRELSKNELVDHINGDGLLNTRSNLRLATHSQNSANQRRGVFKGASWIERRGKWGASIKHNGKTIWLGTFDTAEEAHAVYCEKARELFGEFARFD